MRMRPKARTWLTRIGEKQRRLVRKTCDIRNLERTANGSNEFAMQASEVWWQMQAGRDGARGGTERV